MQKSIEFFTSRHGHTACVIKQTAKNKTMWRFGFSFMSNSDKYDEKIGRTIAFSRAYAPTNKTDEISCTTRWVSHRAALIECLIVDFVRYAPESFNNFGCSQWASDLIEGAVPGNTKWPTCDLKKAGLTKEPRYDHVYADGVEWLDTL